MLLSYYMAKPVLGKSVRSDLFFLGWDVAVRAVSMETFLFRRKAGEFKNCNQNSEKKVNIVILRSETTRKSWKDGKFVEISKMREEDEHSPREFYYPEDLETLDAETETGIAFYYHKPCNKQLSNQAYSSHSREYRPSGQWIP